MKKEIKLLKCVCEKFIKIGKEEEEKKEEKKSKTIGKGIEMYFSIPCIFRLINGNLPNNIPNSVCTYYILRLRLDQFWKIHFSKVSTLFYDNGPVT